MIDYSNVGLLPVADGGITKKYGAKNGDGTIHYGVDFGWINNPKCDVYAWQDGVIVECESYKTGGERGEYVVIEHTYNGKKRWSGYLHLLGNSLTIKKGDEVKRGQVIGKRGNTGKSNGAHLHLYISNKVASDAVYSYETMKKYCNTDPLKWLYIDKQYNRDLGSNVANLPTIPKQIEYPKPVERDESKTQIKINHPNKWLRLRNAPSGDIYEQYCENGIYNIYDKELKNGFEWYKIDCVNGNEFWVAFGDSWAQILSNENNEEVNDLLARINELTERVKSLLVESATTKATLDEVNIRLKNATETIDKVKEILK